MQFKAQGLSHDIGILAGPSALQSDYGQSGNFSSNIKNGSTAIAVAHYLHFVNPTSGWNPNNESLKKVAIRTQIQYISNTNLEHHGKFAEKQSITGEQLRGMKGTVSMINVGVNLEYYLKSLQDFLYANSNMSFNPFLTLGAKYSLFTNTMESDLGDWRQDNTVLMEKYRPEGSLDIGKGSSMSINLGIGTRYKLTEKFDLVAQFNYGFFLSDAVDGLTPDVPENKNNEWNSDLQIGLIYHLSSFF